jgi:hypothetical protein
MIEDIRNLLPGTKVRRGDLADNPWYGVVVFNNTIGAYSDGYPKEHWGYLGPGFMVMYDKAGLVFSASVDDEEIIA